MRNADDLRGFLKNCDEGQRELVDPLIDELIFLENQLNEVKQHPFLRVNPSRPDVQRQTEAFKTYKILIQQYNNCIKTLSVVFNRGANEGEHPFSAWLREREAK